MKSLLSIKKVTLLSFIDSTAKIDQNLIVLLQILGILGDIHSFNPDFSIILGNFNARSNKWWVGENQTSEGSQIDSFTTSHGFKQLMSEPTYILKNSSSCIGLISIDRPSLVIDSSTHPSLRPNFHYKIIHCEIYLKIIYPRSYMRLIWDFKRANISSIRKAIKMID